MQVAVPIVDDALLEVDETFIGNLRLAAGIRDPGTVLFNPDRVKTTIVENDCGKQDRRQVFPYDNYLTLAALIGFSSQSYEAYENHAFVTLKFGVLGGIRLDATIPIELYLLDRSAIGKPCKL